MSDTRSTIAKLPERVSDVEVIVTDTEVEALHLEQNLVKRHRPPFNVRLRDDKSFPYIAVTVEDEYPRVMFTRERHRRGVLYFGPYANAKKVRETLDVLNRVFQFRPCEGPKPGRHSGIPCLDYHIDRCRAPCVGYVSPEEYGEIIDGVIAFLSGDVEPIQRELERKMQDAAAEQRFEHAARYRNRLKSVQHHVGSMVVFEDAQPKKAHYRKFGVRGQDGLDDFAAMAEVISRRFARLSDGAAAAEYDDSLPATPNLGVVDGGKGQLSAALAAMQAHDLPRVAAIALAKREEEVFVPGRPDPIVLERDSPGLQLLQRVRDEAHRFALGFHRQRRDARARESIFDRLPGVGPARRRALIQHFGSAERFLAATQDELEGVRGIPPRTARAIYAQLHKA